MLANAPDIIKIKPHFSNFLSDLMYNIKTKPVIKKPNIIKIKEEKVLANKPKEIPKLCMCPNSKKEVI